MEVINIILIICMVHKWMDEYSCKSTIEFRVYNKNGGKWMYMLMTMVVMAVMMKMMLDPPRIFVVAQINALLLVPLRIPPKGQVFVSSGVSVCWIFDLFVGGEGI
jgi:hypothetical protein